MAQAAGMRPSGWKSAFPWRRMPGGGIFPSMRCIWTCFPVRFWTRRAGDWRICRLGFSGQTTPDPAEILRDDGLRLLRLARFYGQLGFRVDAALVREARRQKGLIRDVSRERIAGEMEKILLCDVKYDKVSRGHPVLRALELLHGTGVLEELLPELRAAEGLPQKKKYQADWCCSTFSIRWPARLRSWFSGWRRCFTMWESPKQ